MKVGTRGWNPPVYKTMIGFGKGPYTYYITQGDGGLLIFVAKCDKCWMGCFWSVMPHFLDNSVVRAIGLKIANQNNLGMSF